MNEAEMSGAQDFIDKHTDLDISQIKQDIRDLYKNQMIQAKELRQSDVYQLAQEIQKIKTELIKLRKLISDIGTGAIQ